MPTTKGAVPGATRRGRFPRLRDFRVRSKLGLILAVPITAIVTLSAVNLVDAGQRADAADDVRSLAVLSTQASGVVHALQNERTAAVNLLTQTSDDKPFNGRKTSTTGAIAEYKVQRDSIGKTTTVIGNRLKTIDLEIAKLEALRQAVAKGTTGDQGISIGDAMFRYDLFIDSLIDLRNAVWQASEESAVTDEVRASAAFSRAKEFAAQEQTIVLGSLYPGPGKVTGQASPAQFRAYQVSTSGQQEALREFYAAASPGQRAAVERIVRGQEVQEVAALESKLDETLAGKDIPIIPAVWVKSTTGKLEKMREAEKLLDESAAAAATTTVNTVRRQVITEASIVLATLLLAVVLALVVARSMVRSLRQLREAAIGVAYEGLPKAVARLRDPEVAGEANPETIAAQLDDPLPVRGRDEFGQVAQAFNVVHREAVRVAAEQAVLRANVATMFVNLARRSQILVDRLIGHLDRLEKGEEDPDRLAALFQLDHLATRMRRNDENLLVLAGADSTRIQRDPAPLGDVLRAAQSEVEHYTRIEFGVIERDIEVAPHAVNDLVHLIAELFDNATAFSPPDTAVVVDARRVGERAVLQVEDRGIGISAEQIAALNERLASPPMVDVAVSRMMGLVVVARLAHRHTIRVELTPARERGIVAQVTLPAEVLAGAMPRQNTRNTPAALAVPAAPLALDTAPARNTGSLFAQNPAPAPGTPGVGGIAAALGGRTDQQQNGAGTGFAAFGQPPAAAAPASAARPVPSWHDLTGADQPPAEAEAPAAQAPEVPETPVNPMTRELPVRRPGATVDSSGQFPMVPAPANQQAQQPPRDIVDAEIVEEPVQATTVIPRQLTASPEAVPVPPAAAPEPQPEPEPVQPAPEPPAEQPTLLGLLAPPGPNAPVPNAAVSPFAPPAPPGGNRPDVTFEMPVVSRQEAAAEAEAAEPVSAEHTQAIPVIQPAAQVAEVAAETAVTPEPQATTAVEPEAAGQPVEAAQQVPEKTPETAPAADALTSEFRIIKVEAAEEPEELLIFREMESAWFTSAGHVPELHSEPEPWSFGEEPVAATGPDTAPDPAPAQEAPVTAEPVQPAPATPARVSPAPPPAATAPAQRWQTAADGGWAAASAASAPAAGGTTGTGLPKRVPMAQLVPGGVSTGTTSMEKRNPEAVRGLLSAYTRGVQRGRKRQPGEPEQPETTTQNSKNGPGKEKA
ncbi:sensor histidine kinase [Longispora albida]|uniref:sensor histidine kinase n=1 Tax=Longispora albida TaxID=203523 RepID=UPI00058D5112|nr:nitrate- and nitrite sensing domain-containing protein [Longispora albida]